MDWDAIYEQENQRERFSAQRNALLDDDDGDVAMDADADTGPAAARPAAPVQEEEPQTPLQQMMRHWVNERHAPDILPAQEGLMMGLLDHLRRQVSSVEGVWKRKADEGLNGYTDEERTSSERRPYELRV